MVFTTTTVFHLHVTTTSLPQPSQDGAQHPLPRGLQERRRQEERRQEERDLIGRPPSSSSTRITTITSHDETLAWCVRAWFVTSQTTEAFVPTRRPNYLFQIFNLSPSQNNIQTYTFKVVLYVFSSHLSIHLILGEFIKWLSGK